MGKSNVEEFATELGLPVDLLLKQLKSSGVDKSSASDELKEEDKSALLAYLRSEHGASLRPKSKITLTRKQNTQIRKTDSEGKSRTIQVEVRKKRTIVKPDQSKDKSSEIIDEKKSSSTKGETVLDTIKNISHERLLHEMSLHQKLICKNNELWNITELGLTYLKNSERSEISEKLSTKD